MTDPLALLLANPADPLARLAAADALEERGQPDAGRLLRCSAALLALPLPDVPRQSMRDYIEHGERGQWWPGHQWQLYPLQEVAMPTAPMGGPGYVGIAGVGRLPGIIAAIRTAEQLFRPADPRCKQALLSHLVRCEMYACRAISRLERDAEHGDGGMGAWVGNVLGFPNEARYVDPPMGVADLWLLRGGPAGRGLVAMHACERWRVVLAWKAFLENASPPDRDYRVRRWQSSPMRRRALALARTYHLDLMECLAQSEPWGAARRLYQAGKQASRAHFLAHEKAIYAAQNARYHRRMKS